MRIIVTDMEKCTGCKLCALACSLFHYDKFSLKNARIHVRIEEATNHNVPLICEQCGEHLCADACPREAIYHDEKVGIYNVDRRKCNGCGLCVQSCPYDGMRLDTENVAIKCDLCGGDPECVKYCVFPHAIQYVEADEKMIARKLKNMLVKIQSVGVQ